MDFSDDSDFYGDEDTVSRLHDRVEDFDVEAWTQQQQSHPGYARPQATVATDLSHLHNPYAGVPYAWQLTESVDDFLTRLPPKTTEISDKTPWIFICNPYIHRRDKSLSENQLSKGNEDEAPEEEGARTLLVQEGGFERLQLLNKFIEQAKKAGMAPSSREREVLLARREAAEDILHLAHAAKVRAGKWMLFCRPAEVNDVWDIVAKATANNELGIAAKVAPKPLEEDSRKDRIVCVYTSDFSDKADVGRVLQRLRELRLVEPRSRPIYYKPDAYTYVGIASGNPWGMRASLYSSSDFQN